MINKEPPKLICPECKENILSPRWRASSLLIPLARQCPCPRKVPLIAGGDYWFHVVIGSCLLVIGGRLLKTDLPTIVSLLFLASGCGTMIRGLFQCKLVTVEKAADSSHTQNPTQEEE